MMVEWRLRVCVHSVHDTINRRKIGGMMDLSEIKLHYQNFLSPRVRFQIRITDHLPYCFSPSNIDSMQFGRKLYRTIEGI